MFSEDLSDSSFDFQRIVWPAVSDNCGGGELALVEGSTKDDLKKSLDVLAGIDAWQIIKNSNVMRGIASRVQWGKNWRTFTIRKSRSTGTITEYEKRLKAIDESTKGWLLPHLTCQGYLDQRRVGSFLGAAVVRTKELYCFVRDRDSGRSTWYVQNTTSDGYKTEEFIVVPWDNLRSYGVEVKESSGIENPRLMGSEPGAGGGWPAHDSGARPGG